MKRDSKIAFFAIIIPIFAVFALASSVRAQSTSTNACQLPDNGLVGGVVLDRDAPGVIPQYTVGDNLTATVTASGCDGTVINFSLCPVNQDCPTTGKTLGSATMSGGSAKVSITVSQFNNFNQFRIHAEAPTVSWKSDSSPFNVAGATTCVVNSSSAVKNSSGVWNFTVSTNNNCQGQQVQFQLTVVDSSLGSSAKGSVANCTVANSTCTASWTATGYDPTTQSATFQTCIGTVCTNTSLTGGVQGSTTSGNSAPVSSLAPQNYNFSITNPLGTSGPNTIFDVINVVSQWVLNISIPLAVLAILYAGFLFLTAGPSPANVGKAKSILTNVVIGLAIIFIGKGFVTLVQSIVQSAAGGSSTTATTIQYNCSSTATCLAQPAGQAGTYPDLTTCQQNCQVTPNGN